MHPGVCAAREHGVPSSTVSPPHRLGQGLSPNLELITSARAAGLGASEICLCWYYRYAWPDASFMWVLGIRTQVLMPTCTADALSSKPSLMPLKVFFFLSSANLPIEKQVYGLSLWTCF